MSRKFQVISNKEKDLWYFKHYALLKQNIYQPVAWKGNMVIDENEIYLPVALECIMAKIQAKSKQKRIKYSYYGKWLVFVY